jgi:neutral ceramidase
MLLAGEGICDITPPLGIELAGFHRAQGKERRIEAIRKPAAVRALVLEVDRTRVAIVQHDMLAVSAAYSKRVQNAVAQKTGIPAAHVRVCATHTHSMPTFCYLRQWGAISPEYMAWAETKALQAVELAVADLAESDCYVGQQGVAGGNFNRTSKTWKNDNHFDANATDADRWLDTTASTVYFQRADRKRNLMWYHFCAHPVCYQDAKAGPDWPGLVADYMKSADNLDPGFLQGHIGDVNPGDGTKWIGDAEPTATAIAPNVRHATQHSEWLQVDSLRIETATVKLPFDMERHNADLAFFREHPDQCTKDIWVDPGFASAWAATASKWPPTQTDYIAPISAMKIGGLALLFHPAELYSFYGLKLRLTSPFPVTLCVGYCDDFVGYLTDPKAYENKEYAALVVPKILDLPPFKTSAAGELTMTCQELLKNLV